MAKQSVTHLIKKKASKLFLIKALHLSGTAFLGIMSFLFFPSNLFLNKRQILFKPFVIWLH